MKHSKMVFLGDYIDYCDERNNNEEYTLDYVRGISIEKKMIYTKANMEGVSLKPYKLFKPEEFCFVPVTSRNGNKLTISMNYEEETYIVSSAYEVFKVKDNTELLPDYLFLLFCRPEFDRYARFHSWGSAREAFTYDDMCRVQIPLPSIVTQREVVDAWKAFREIKNQNEGIAAPLMQVCQSYIQELKHTYESVEIGEYIEEITRTNSEGIYGLADVKGVSNDKTMREYKGSLEGRDFKKFLLIKEDEFVFNKRTNAGMGLCLVKDRPYLFTEDYEAFRIKDTKKLIPDYLYLFIHREEFDRYVLFNSWGSSVIFFHIADMKHVKIPIPPEDIQRSVVNLFQCANEAKRIAEEADRKSREVCPALIQYVINS